MALRPRPATRPAPIAGTGVRRPLVITGDEDLLDDLLRLAAAAGTEVDVASDPAAARGRYLTAPLVLVGFDQAVAWSRARLPRRPDVAVVTYGPPDAPGDPGPVDAAAEHGPSALGGDRGQFYPSQGPDSGADATVLRHATQVRLPAAEAWLTDRLASCQGRPVPAPVVAVLGGRGGAGASLLAAGLAWTAAERGRRVLLVDADPLGGGLDLALGWEGETGPRWPELSATSGRVDPPAMVDALPGRGDLALLSFDRRDLPAVPAEAMAAVLDAGRHARDLVVVDLPRRLDEAAELALQAADLGLLVVPAEVRAVMAARRVAAAALAHCANVQLVVRGPAPGGLTSAQVSRFLRLPVAAALRPDSGLSAVVEAGRAPTAAGRGPLADLCRRLVADLCPNAGHATASSRLRGTTIAAAVPA